jgi:hypothetical protein
VTRTTLILGIYLLVALGCGGQTEPAPQAAPAQAQLARKIPEPPAEAPPVVDPAAQPDAALLAKAHEYTERFYRGELDLLHDAFSPGLKEEVSLEQLSTVYEYVRQNFGKQTEIISEDTAVNDEYRGFVRWARFEKTDRIIEIRWTLRRDDDTIAEFWIRPSEKRTGSSGDL